MSVCQHALKSQSGKCQHGYAWGSTCEKCIAECPECWDLYSSSASFCPRPSSRTAPGVERPAENEIEWHPDGSIYVHRAPCSTYRLYCPYTCGGTWVCRKCGQEWSGSPPVHPCAPRSHAVQPEATPPVAPAPVDPRQRKADASFDDAAVPSVPVGDEPLDLDTIEAPRPPLHSAHEHCVPVGEVEKLAEEWERCEKTMRALHEDCMRHGDEPALDTARLARDRSKLYRDCAAALRSLIRGGK